MKCSYCNQDLASAPHAGNKYCPVCGQGIDDAADLNALRAENAKLREALQNKVNKWRDHAKFLRGESEHAAAGTLDDCADEIESALAALA